jgi:hypothetical protein
MHSYICIVTPYLGTLAETCEGPDVELTRNDIGGPISEMEGSDKCYNEGMLAKPVSSDKL